MDAQPQRIVHADWSTAADKRWAARADLQPDGTYRVGAPGRITPAELLATAREGAALLGFDFPIGIPAAYARRAGIASFPEWLPLLGRGAWSPFFEVARTREEISLSRPFYPNRSGGTKRDHLVRALDLDSADALYRHCDVATGRRACPIFWTLGGNQVGKAALTGWREVLQPARADDLVHLWPFEGNLRELLSTRRTVVAETYPGDVYPYVGASLPQTEDGRGKRSRGSRAACANGIVEWARDHGIVVSAELDAELRDGFGAAPTGEDRFDAVIGALGMIAVVRGVRSEGVPEIDEVRRVEGWILGRSPT